MVFYAFETSIKNSFELTWLRRFRHFIFLTATLVFLVLLIPLWGLSSYVSCTEVHTPLVCAARLLGLMITFSWSPLLISGELISLGVEPVTFNWLVHDLWGFFWQICHPFTFNTTQPWCYSMQNLSPRCSSNTLQSPALAFTFSPRIIISDNWLGPGQLTCMYMH